MQQKQTQIPKKSFHSQQKVGRQTLNQPPRHVDMQQKIGRQVRMEPYKGSHSHFLQENDGGGRGGNFKLMTEGCGHSKNI
jgi:hypothetical protein